MKGTLLVKYLIRFPRNQALNPYEVRQMFIPHLVSASARRRRRQEAVDDVDGGGVVVIDNTFVGATCRSVIVKSMLAIQSGATTFLAMNASGVMKKPAQM